VGPEVEFGRSGCGRDAEKVGVEEGGGGLGGNDGCTAIGVDIEPEPDAEVEVDGRVEEEGMGDEDSI
jgi:hypothetical protein